jgi:hypothetical protein
MGIFSNYVYKGIFEWIVSISLFLVKIFILYKKL